MGLNQDMVGHRYPDTEPYEVCREKVREFAEAIGAPPADGAVPPTFAVVIALPATRQASFDPAIGVDYTRVVHGEQRFVHHRALRAGDVVTARVTVTDIRPAGTNWLLTTTTDLHLTDDDTLVCTATSTIVVRGDES